MNLQKRGASDGYWKDECFELNLTEVRGEKWTQAEAMAWRMRDERLSREIACKRWD